MKRGDRRVASWPLKPGQVFEVTSTDQAALGAEIRLLVAEFIGVEVGPAGEKFGRLKVRADLMPGSSSSALSGLPVLLTGVSLSRLRLRADTTAS